MARITVEQIAQALEPEGWKIISTDYQNLDTQLEFMCAEGHKVYAPWGKLRNKLECPVCKQNKFKDDKPVIIPKGKQYRVLGLDQATYNTGWSIFDGNRLIKYGLYSTKGTTENERAHEVKTWLLSMIEDWKPDIIAIEGIQLEEKFGVTTFQTLARLQGILLNCCYELGLKTEVCAPATWRAHCGVKGRSRSDKKKSMQTLVKQEWDITVPDDIADALGIGKYIAETHTKKTKIESWE